ncbi:uncharacterized protein LOC124922410 [Impatiens glandulifera]|uniref:uncharacterized protein LOC124922410 n=1 Tax=Impatiens glandulifera TaxID=253017 RepID=UPI001FB099EE|nr:uncharacterized protein LOC124922410 [Impatiens glandulifera]
MTCVSTSSSMIISLLPSHGTGSCLFMNTHTNINSSISLILSFHFTSPTIISLHSESFLFNSFRFQTMTDLPTDTQIPLLSSTDQMPENPPTRIEKIEDFDTDDVDKTLCQLERIISFLGFNQPSIQTCLLSWVVFLLFGVSFPVIMIDLFNCDGCESFQNRDFEISIVIFQACLAAISLLCLSYNLRKYGIRKFLFVDRYSGQACRFQDEYIQKIRDSISSIIFWVIPCLVLKTVREVVRVSYQQHNFSESKLVRFLILSGLVASWTYVSAIYLTACVIFHLVCNLQIIHFDDYGKFMERHSNVMVYIEEHSRLRHYLSKISHRFRIYLLLIFWVVTASQFITLFQTTGYTGNVNLINGGDFAVSSVVQVVGTILCLNAAAKISHRAQGIAALASKWHASVTCNVNNNEQLRVSNSNGSLDRVNSMESDSSDSDMEDSVNGSQHSASHMTSYHKRQAFVLYLQTNPGGITIFGWTVDRGLINTIFFTELSLVLFVLGKTLISASE